MTESWLAKTSYAHRGLHGSKTGFVENSLSAFKEAAEKGIGIELDVLLSRDNIAMVFHDTELSRLTAHEGKTIDYTAEELSKITLSNSTDVIPSLQHVLSQIGAKTRILIEIKGDQGQFNEIAEAVWSAIRFYPDDIAIMSFYPEIIKYFKAYYPGVPRGLVATTVSDGELPKEYLNPEKQLRLIKSLDVDFIAYDIRILPNKVTRYCQNHNIPVLTWTVRTDEDRLKAKNNTDNIIFEL
ncbi:MAG: glycerophosphodiester phosphodiesterase [Alphaproteobacteria bacterium]|nr:glycerophosphodiester phosphodiesterase [Alphaproteobacteria bacterium]HPF46939.1 glycerophosphodiester phosphodiesterase family protein [Emcibacteraceae bacterium]